MYAIFPYFKVVPQNIGLKYIGRKIEKDRVNRVMAYWGFLE